MYEVSIIIVNYNSNDYLVECINSIVTHTTDVNYEILVIDNNSMDEFEVGLTHNYSNLRYIKLDRNYGFSKAVNIGISNTNSKYIFLLNPDTLLLNNACKYFYDFMDLTDSFNVWCCGGILLDKKKNVLKSYDEYPTINKVFVTQIGLSKLYSSLKSIINHNPEIIKCKFFEVQLIIGADMFIRRSCIEKIGYFNESFFLNYEEVEISLRAQNAGYRSMILPEVKIIHFGSKSFPDKKTYLETLRDGELIFFKVTKSKIEFLMVKLLHLIGAILRLILFFDTSQLSYIKKILAS